MRVVVTGATGTIGRAVVHELRKRGDDIVALTRDPGSALQVLGPDVELHQWADPKGEPPPAAGLADADAVVHLLGEPVAQRWSKQAMEEIHNSRVLATRHLVEGMAGAGARLHTLVSQSASGYYGPHGDELVDESFPAASEDFLGEVTVAWEAEAKQADELGARVALMRTGVVLSKGGGALEKMLPPFKLGVGGPVAGGRQYVPWIHLDDVVGAFLFALDDAHASGPVNVSAPRPVTNAELSKALGRVLHRPAFMPVPGVAVKLLFGDMASIVTSGVRMVPKRLEELGYRFRRPDLEDALRDATGR
ncbi:MAG: uncharacterized protein QOI65_1898 [Thermoleophilaceae bacterium]|nr:uncharacterized protein [Thermoleophilaceae bacterium]